MTEDELFSFYRDTFQIIYADLVAVTVNKPIQVLIEIENAFTHLSSAKADPSSADSNFIKAKGHLVRASLDCAKMLWVEQARVVKDFADDEDLKRYCVNCSEDEFVTLITKADRLAVEARRHEMQNVGIDPTAAIDMYYEAALGMRDALEKCDFAKLATFKKFKFGFWLRHHSVALIVGLVSGFVVAYFS